MQYTGADDFTGGPGEA